MSDANKLKKHTELRDHYQRQLDYIRADLDHPPAFFLDDPRGLSRKPTEEEQRRIKTLEQNIANEDAAIEGLQRHILGSGEHPDSDSPKFEHSDTFSMIKFRGEWHKTLPRQATVIAALYAARNSGLPGLPHDDLLKKLGVHVDSVRDVFKGSPLWKTLVVVKDGLYMLSLPNRT